MVDWHQIRTSLAVKENLRRVESGSNPLEPSPQTVNSLSLVAAHGSRASLRLLEPAYCQAVYTIYHNTEFILQ